MDKLGPTRVIPQSEWSLFFDDFSRRNGGSLCKMEVLGKPIGAQIETQGMRLAGASAEVGHSVARIYLRVGQDEAAVTHVVSSPWRVRIKQTKEGADEALEIEAAELKTLLTFPMQALPAP